MYIGLGWWSCPCCFLPALFLFDLDPPPGFEPPPPGGCFECEEAAEGGTAGAWGRLGMVVVSPEADPDVFDAEAGPDPVGGGPAEVLEATEAAVTGEAESVFGTGYLNEVDIIK